MNNLLFNSISIGSVLPTSHSYSLKNEWIKKLNAVVATTTKSYDIAINEICSIWQSGVSNIFPGLDAAYEVGHNQSGMSYPQASIEGAGCQVYVVNTNEIRQSIPCYVYDIHLGNYVKILAKPYFKTLFEFTRDEIHLTLEIKQIIVNLKLLKF